MSRTDVLGVGFDDLTMEEAVEAALGFMNTRGAHYACTPNPEIVMAAKKDAALRSALGQADLVLADGVGVTKAAAMLKTPLKARVPGIDFATAVIAGWRSAAAAYTSSAPGPAWPRPRLPGWRRPIPACP